MLEAESVTVAEDPRFGHEYFLRAQSLGVRLRWPSLLRGHLELGTLSLSQPNLNLVRNASGDWNLAEWLPRPPDSLASPTPHGPVRAPGHVLRFRRIDIEDGRINFKHGNEKLPFAFTNVGGYVDAESPGRWQLNLEAVPSRAAVAVQHAGTLHLAATVGGTSSRLRPAMLDFSWAGASISDVLRLVRNYDYGVRGTLDLSIGARTAGDVWNLQGRAELGQLHRWNLAARSDNPSVNLSVQAKLNLEDSVLELTGAALDAPHSNIHAVGSIDWSQPGESSIEISSAGASGPDSSGIDLADVLPWLHAFRSGVADDLALHGTANLQMAIDSWPPQLHGTTLSVEPATLAGPRLRVPVRLGSLTAKYDSGNLRIAPVTLSFGTKDGSLRMEASAISAATAGGYSTVHVSGNVAHVRDLITTAAAFGWNLSRGWDLEGPMRCDLQWQGTPDPWQAQPTGSVEWGSGDGNASLRAPFLNRPVDQIRGRAEWKPESHVITLASARAFGANWSGTFERRDSSGEWQFDLAADRIDAADLDRWLNPRWRESFFDRMLPFLNPQSSAIALPESLRGTGRISVERFSLAPLELRRVQGNLKVEGRTIELSAAHAQFYGGNIAGSFGAELKAAPAYRASLDFTHVDLAALGAAVPSLANLFSGSATGEISLQSIGSSRADLTASLECDGSARVDNAELRGINLPESVRAGARRGGVSLFREASGAFTCGGGKIALHRLVLLAPGGEIDAAGAADFQRNLDLRLRVPPSSTLPGGASSANSRVEEYRLTGPLAAPQITTVSAPPAPH